MRQEAFDRIVAWFDRYVSGYLDLDPEGVRNIRLKQEHSRKVLEVMTALALGEGLGSEESRLVAAVAILHDVGRFPQYRRWRTFRDRDSANHARLGLEVLRDQRVLMHLAPAEQLLIEEAIRFHNLLEVPKRYRSPHDRAIRLIRDADKLDIWRVFDDYFQQLPDERASAAGLGLPDRPEVTPVCLAALGAGQIVRLDMARVLNDFVLLQISWAYDLSTKTAYRLLDERGYLSRLAALLPDLPEVQAAVGRAQRHLEEATGFLSAGTECPLDSGERAGTLTAQL